MRVSLMIFMAVVWCAGVPLLAPSQEKPRKCWIYFSSKDDLAALQKSSVSETALAIGISERALQRRAKVGQLTIAPEDFPVSASYLAQLKELGIKIENTSRWFNAATAYITPVQSAQIRSLPFVRSVEPVATFSRKVLPATGSMPQNLSKQSVTKFSYGQSQSHMESINAIAVHNIGISGRGVLVGMLDTGFRWKLHEAMQNMKVIAEYDFIQKDNNTANEGDDALSQDSHGTSTMSLVGAIKEGQLVSPAFNASFILAKTEDIRSEKHIEEDNWVAGIEWMEQHGVDVVSSSLGYDKFPQDPGRDYTYTDMNGRTATTSKAAVIAARKGVVVVNAIGNEGANASPPSLTTPADADSIVSVGAVGGSGSLAGFSSNGPTSDGRIKPDVVAHGIGTYCATPGKIGYSGSSQGTSLATPLVAGTAAMILSAHPELTPMQVIDALRMTASNAGTPNNAIGWGIIDAYKAVLYHGMVIGTDPEVSLMNDNSYSVGVYVASNVMIKKDSVRLLYTTDNGTTFSSVTMRPDNITDAATNSGKYSAVMPASTNPPRFYVRAVDAFNLPRTSPYRAPADLYDSQAAVPSEFALHQNYPNPFNPSTTIGYHIPSTGRVTLSVYDLLGRKVATLVNSIQSLGSYDITFNGAGLASGVYFYRLQTDNFIETKRMMMVK